MARRPREDAPGLAHHVMFRGIERRALFVDDLDRADLLGRLSRLIPQLGFRCYAWCLMPNHVHLVVQSGPVRVSRLMARLGTGYAGRFNARHGRVGHLFQNRFRSRPVVNDSDLQGVVLYVNRNPLEGGLVEGAEALEEFPWCGLGSLLARRSPEPFESVGETLALFHRDPAHARRRLRRWLGGSTAIPGAMAPEPDRPPPPPASVASHDAAFAEIVADACRRFGVSEGELGARGRPRRVSAARREIARRASRGLGMSGSEIARRLGLTKAAVSRVLREPPPHPLDS